MVIKTVKEIAVERAVECQAEVGARFKHSIGIVYGYDEGGKFIAYGSCVFLEVSGEKYLVTAAHVVDDAKQYGFAIVGSAGVFQIADDFRVTSKIEGSRLKDKHDFAFLRLTTEILDSLGEAVAFIDSSEVSQNRGSMDGRQYLVLGFPAAKNNRLIDRQNNRLRPQPWSYLGTCTSIDAATITRTGLSPDTNVAVKFDPDQVGNNDGVNTTPPDTHGVSGGALVDLGLAHPDNLSGESPCTGHLAGIMMEMHKGEKLLVAVRIEHVLRAIKAEVSP